MLPQRMPDVESACVVDNNSAIATTGCKAFAVVREIYTVQFTIRLVELNKSLEGKLRSITYMIRKQ